MDIQHIRERTEFLALETLVVMLMKTLREASPSFAQSLPQALVEAGEKLKGVHPKGASPEQGDLLMGELQEAWANLTQRVLK